MPEAFRHAPTLMAGEVAGSQGEVRVWSPDKKLIRAQALAGLAALAAAPLYWFLLVYLLISLHYPGPQTFLSGALLGMVLTSPYIGAWLFGWERVRAFPALRRPCYITTDDAGIGVTTWRGSRALSWNDIVACSYHPIHNVLLLKPRNGRWFQANLSGYAGIQRAELIAVVTGRADLALVKDWSKISSCLGKKYARPGYRISLSGHVALSGAAALPPKGEPGVER